jgi:PKD repeat protein
MLCVGFVQSYSQTCNFTYHQTNNKDTFLLPTFSTNYTVDSVRWYFGDGLDSVEYSTTISSSMPHSYLFSGTYIVCLNVWLTEVSYPIPIFCTSCDTIDIQCHVNFIADTSGNTITANELNSLLPGQITSYSWDYGDGSPQDTTSSIYHAYDTVGNYNLCLTIQGMTPLGNPYQCSACSTIEITKSCQLYTNFDLHQSNKSIKCYNYSYSNNDCFTAVDSLDFGDGTSFVGYFSLAYPAVHIYDQWGNYNVCLYRSAYTFGGSIVRDTFCIPISIYPSCAVRAEWGYQELEGLKIKFTDSTISVGNCSIGIGNRFVFGDGGIASTISILVSSFDYYEIHTYSNPGLYHVCLISEGHKYGQGSFYDTLCRDIIVDYCEPKAEFSYVASALDVDFKDSTIYSGQCLNSDGNYFDFGDNNISQMTLPNTANDKVTHKYRFPGTYKVCLISEASNTFGRKGYDTLCKHIQIESSFYDNETALSIYPNPVSNILSMVFPLNEIGIPQHMMVSDITGRIISNQQYVPDLNGEIQIDFKQFTRGIYFVFNHVANKSRKQFKVFKE